MSMIKYNNEYRKLITVYYNNGTNITQVSEIKNNNNTVFSKALENVSYIVTYYNYDGTIADTETVASGENATGNVSIITKPDSAQYTYSFIGWSTTENDTTVDANALANIVADKSLYPVYSETLRTFTVYFYNESTLLETVSNVPYGGTATYTGSTPTKTNYTFTGWSPSNVNITSNTSCYAQFVDDDMYESISDTWSEIIANVSNGTYSTKYQVGDTKKIDLGTEGEVIMTIVGIDIDDLADNSGKAPITWISKQLLKTGHRMNPSKQSGTEGTGAIGGWEYSEMRSYLKNTIKPLIPSNIRSAIKEVTKYSKICDTSGTEINNSITTDDVWIPSTLEMNVTGVESLGASYSNKFTRSASRVKKSVDETIKRYWLRSAHDVTTFKIIGSDGVNYYDYARSDHGIALGFCT